MSRYTYDAAKVDSAITELNNALSAIADITAEFQAAANTITSARGAKYIDMDLSQLNQLQTLAEDAIENDTRTIQEKATIIEDYNNSGFFKKMFATAGMALTKFAEGVVSVGEDLVDGAVSIVGFTGGLFNSDFKNACAEFVAKDHVGDFMADKYENGFLKNINNYSAFSHESTWANVFKGIGVAAPYVVLSFTGVGLITETAAAGLSGIGQGTETGINKRLVQARDAGMTDVKAGDVFNSAFGDGLWQGAKNAALVYAMGKISQTAQANAAKKGAGAIDEVSTIGGKNGEMILTNEATKATDDLFKATSTKAGASTGAKATAAVSDDAAKLTFGEKAFTRAGDSKLAKVMQGSDDLIKTGANKVGQATGAVGAKINKIPVVGKVTTLPGKAVSGIKGLGRVATKAPVVGNVIKGAKSLATTAVAKAPLVTYGVTATAFTADQISQQYQGSEIRTYNKEVALATPKVAPDIQQPVGDIDPNYDPNNSVNLPPDTQDDGDINNVTPPNTTPDPGYNNYGPSSNGGGNYGDTPSVPDTQPNTTPETTPQTTPDTTPQTTPYDPPYQEHPTDGGGGYNNDGYTGEETNPEDPNVGDGDLDTGGMSGSLSDILTGGDDYVNIPQSSSSITSPTQTTSKKSVIPIIAGLSAATVAGIGTKAYLDKKEDGETEDFESEEWEGDESMDLNYGSDPLEDEERDYLNPTDEYAYQEEPIESYEAVNSSELASMQ